ncbi:MAG: aminopeptidase N [Rhodobacterales bacterium]|nr:MAG: aminopeptidase N [Rhodobacterales bacterium]
MTAEKPTIYLADYTPAAYLVDTVELSFKLAPDATRVTSRIAFYPNPDSKDRQFVLDGEHLTLISARIDGQEVSPEITDTGLRCDVPDAPFIWECEVEISPIENTALSGLYMSNGMYCTQCEAQGFRRITYYPDRPDVMATFSVRVESDLPVLLSNGNPVDQGEGWAQWHDPWPKPAYLFALVAGDLKNHPGQFTTQSGREVTLNVWVRPDDINKCAFAMQALQSSMRWDEQVYGREYDLDVFNIVAVDDFNMGAMENKGLNIFNSSCVLASPETSTDANYNRIEAIIAHEYFHNWTGNRITCRDWFQLCLKEGLTVFRDSQFTADMRGAAVKRISDVIALRNRQFSEDNGPLAHPVRPSSFQEINNFYTATVYEKGAEVIGMLKRLVGDAAYYKALDLYFERHDGQACTIEDWLKVFEDSTGRDLSQFKRWYSQAGTPRLTVEDDFKDGRYTLHFKQQTPPTPGQDDKQPQLLPIAVGLLNDRGEEIVQTRILEMTEAEQSFTFDGLDAKPVPSILREFSAPVILHSQTDTQTRAFLLAHDTDPFNRWQAADALAKELLQKMVLEDAKPEGPYLETLAKITKDESLDPAFRALILSRPSQSSMAEILAEQGHVPDPEALYQASKSLSKAIAEKLGDDLKKIYDNHQVMEPYLPDAESAAHRSLANAALALLSRLDQGKQASAQFYAADNMTQQLAALACLQICDYGAQATADFYRQWQQDRLVIDNWFAMQIVNAKPENAATKATELTNHPDFNMKNPNRFRAVFGALFGNHAGFHIASGAGYELLADWLIRLDPVNPQTTARMMTGFQSWRRYDAGRQALIRQQLERIANTPDLSPDTSEMVARILNG